MKKIRLVLTVAAFAFAVTMAVGFKPVDGIKPSYIYQGACERTTLTCNGTQNACLLDVPGDGVTGTVQIYEFENDANCGVTLKMN